LKQNEHLTHTFVRIQDVLSIKNYIDHSGSIKRRVQRDFTACLIIFNQIRNSKIFRAKPARIKSENKKIEILKKNRIKVFIYIWKPVKYTAAMKKNDFYEIVTAKYLTWALKYYKP
jgi:hypothetical protein